MRRFAYLTVMAIITSAICPAAAPRGLGWAVDPTQMTLSSSGETFADADLAGSPIFPPVWRPFARGCPAWVVPPPPGP